METEEEQNNVNSKSNPFSQKTQHTCHSDSMSARPRRDEHLGWEAKGTAMAATW